MTYSALISLDTFYNLSRINSTVVGLVSYVEMYQGMENMTVRLKWFEPYYCKRYATGICYERTALNPTFFCVYIYMYYELRTLRRIRDFAN